MKIINFVVINILVLFFYACTDQILNTMIGKEDAIQTNKEILTSDSSITYSDKPVCGTKDVTVWLFDHYEPKTGKTLGIWPEIVSQSLWAEYRTKWGFSNIVVTASSNSYSTALSAGFTTVNILTQISNYPNYQSVINTFNSNYLIDEPLERGTFSVAQLLEISNYSSIHRPLSSFNLDSYNNTLPVMSMYLIAVSNSNSYILNDFYENPLLLNFDQRDEWSYFKNYYTSKNLSNWISASKDIDEFNQLFGHANNLNLSSLRLFIGSDGGGREC